MLPDFLVTLAGLSIDEISASEKSFQKRQIHKGDHWLHAGDTSDQLVFLSKGVARFYYLAPDGKEFNKSFIKPGDVMGSLSCFLNDEPSPFSIQALTENSASTISYRGILSLSENYVGWNRLHITLLQQLAVKKEKREADFLLLSAEDRYRQFLLDHVGLLSTIPQYHIASYLGITEVALSRIRKRMALT